MMAKHENNLSPVPQGGYQFEVVELGPPKYMGQQPHAKARGHLIPVGDGEGLSPRPAPPLARKRRLKQRKSLRCEVDLLDVVLSGVERAILYASLDSPKNDEGGNHKMAELVMRLALVRVLRELFQQNPRAYPAQEIAHCAKTIWDFEAIPPSIKELLGQFLRVSSESDRLTAFVSLKQSLLALGEKPAE